jgi:1-acyl-sn-glycerol-3-phosphate acyltransferase
MGVPYSVSRLLLDGLLGVASGWEVRGRENIPRTGGLIVASNHISYMDPPLIGTAAVRVLHYLAKEELFRQPLLGPLITAFHAIPIRRGMADLSGLARAIDVLKSGAALIMFPEGSRMRDGELHPARPGVGMLAVGGNAKIVPCFISGSDRPNQWFLRRVKLSVSFGPARTWQELAGDLAAEPPGRALYQCIADGVMRDIAALKAAQPNKAPRGTA